MGCPKGRLQANNSREEDIDILTNISLNGAQLNFIHSFIQIRVDKKHVAQIVTSAYLQYLSCWPFTFKECNISTLAPFGLLVHLHYLQQVSSPHLITSQCVVDRKDIMEVEDITRQATEWALKHFKNHDRTSLAEATATPK